MLKYIKAKKKRKIVFEYIFIAIGAAMMAVGIGIFMVEAQVVPGGVSGLSISIAYLSGNVIPIGLTMWVFNVPLFIWGLKELGRSFALRTFYAFTLNSIFIDLFRGDIPGLNFIKLQNLPSVQYLLNHDFLFFILIGAVLLGLGLGIIFKFKGTTAGSDIVAAIMNKRYGIKTGQAIVITDFFVISIAGIIIELKGLSPEKPALILTLYAIFALILSSKLIDAILDGFDYARVAHIISDKSTEIADKILSQLNRGATAFKTRGMYRNVEGEVVMTVVPVKELEKLKDLVREIDPEAFVIINNVHEVLGRGFHRRF